MIITFAQYCILTAAYCRATASEIQEKTTFSQLMTDYYLSGLLRSNLIRVITGKTPEQSGYEITEQGLDCLEDYELANRELIIRRASYETERI